MRGEDSVGRRGPGVNCKVAKWLSINDITILQEGCQNEIKYVDYVYRGGGLRVGGVKMFDENHLWTAPKRVGTRDS